MRKQDRNKAEQELLAYFRKEEQETFLPEEKKILTTAGAETPKPEKGDPSGRKFPVRGVIIIAACLAFVLAAIPLVLMFKNRDSGMILPSPGENLRPSSDGDPVYTARSIEVVPQWETAEGLTVLSALWEEESAKDKYLYGLPALQLLSASASPETRQVSLSSLTGARSSREVSGRFLPLTFKTDEQTGFDTRLFAEFEGTYYDLEKEELFCIGYEAAKAFNRDREDELRQIYYLLGGSKLVEHPKEVDLMVEAYRAGLNYYYCTYPGWEGLCSSYPSVVENDFYLTTETKKLLDEFFATGDADLSGYGEEEEWLRAELAYERTVVLRDGFGEVSVLEFGANTSYALITRTITGVDPNNPWQRNIYLYVFDRENGTFTLLNDPQDMGSIYSIRSDVLADSAYKSFGYQNYETGLAIRIYTSSGATRIVSHARETGQWTRVPLEPAGSLALSPSEKYLYVPCASDDGKEHWAVIPFNVSPYDAFLFTGHLLRFVLDDAAVVLDTAQGIRAYSTRNGDDVTETVFGGELAAYESYALEESDAGLSRIHLPDGERTLIASRAAYDAFAADRAQSCVYLANLRGKTVDAVLLATGETAYSIRIDDRFLREAKHADEISLGLDRSQAILVLSGIRLGDMVFDPDRYREEYLPDAELYMTETSIGAVDNFHLSTIPYWILPSIKHPNGGYLHLAPGEDINVNATKIEKLGAYIAIEKLQRAVEDDMLVSMEEYMDIVETIADGLIQYLDIDPDGTVRVAEGVMERLFGAELNPGQSFSQGTYLPFIKAWGLDANPGYLRKFAEVNAKAILKNSNIGSEDLSAFIAAVADRLEDAYRKHYSLTYNMYEQVHTEDLLAMKDAVREMAVTLAENMASDPEGTVAAIQAYPLPDFNETFIDWGNAGVLAGE